MKLCVHTAILSIKTVCWAHEFKVPEKSYNISIRPWSYKRVVLCSGKTGTTVLKQCVKVYGSLVSSKCYLNDSKLLFRFLQFPNFQFLTNFVSFCHEWRDHSWRGRLGSDFVVSLSLRYNLMTGNGSKYHSYKSLTDYFKFLLNFCRNSLYKVRL